VISPGSGAHVRLETGYGRGIVRYRRWRSRWRSCWTIGPDGLRATAATFDDSGTRQILAALVEAVR